MPWEGKGCTAEMLAWPAAFPARLLRGVKREFLTPWQHLADLSVQTC